MAQGENLMGDMLDVLKDISEYLSKAEDATLTKTPLADKPKVGESQAKKDPITGGSPPAGKPGEDVIKAEKDEDEEEDEKEDEPEEKEDEDEKDDVEELKSLLKDIKSALEFNQETLVKSITSEVKKSLPTLVKGEIPAMLRKMGFSPSIPDIRRLGLDTVSDVKKSEYSEENDEISGDVDIKKADKIIDDLSHKSWSQLGQLREKLGDFNTFPR